MKKLYKVLVIDDDFEILKLMKNILELQNFSVTTYQKIELPIRLADFTGYDLILLDVMMPNIDGMELCQTIRNHITTPIIFVSAKDTENDIIKGLNLGGDDYITKPFSIKQLVAKIEAHLKREERSKQAKKAFQEFKREFLSITVYLQEKRICVNKNQVPLTNREYAILELLSSQPKKVFTRENIYEHVYNDDSDTLFRSISEYVYQIRQKFSVYGINPIKTVRGVGYQWHD